MIIGLTGKAGSGKDTAADYLVSRHGFVKMSFAAPLKRALNAMFGWDMAQWDDRVWKETVLKGIGKSPRQLAQTLGTEWGRQRVKESLWIDLAIAEAAMLVIQRKKVVITDCRFDNEAAAIHKAGGMVLGIVRSTDAVAAHVSEKPINPFNVNHFIHNTGSINDLHVELASAINHVYGGTTWQG